MKAIDRMILAERIERDPLLMDSADLQEVVRWWPENEYNRVWNSYVCALASVNPTADTRNATRREEALV